MNGEAKKRETVSETAVVSGDAAKATDGASHDITASADQESCDTKVQDEGEPLDSVEQIVGALEGRAEFYDLLASFYFMPLTEEQIENMAGMDLSAYADIDELFAEGLHDITRYLMKRNTGTRQELAVDFTGAFIGTSTWKGKSAVPYESVFTSEEGILFQESYHEVYQLYKKNHVAHGEGYDYPDDHLSFMCAFMSILSKRTIEAIKDEDYVLAIEQVQTSRKFLEDHILSWFDDFQELALHLIHTRFYRGVLKVSKGFFTFDDQSLGELEDELAAYQESRGTKK